MHDIRDLLSGPLHIAQILFGSEITHIEADPSREENRMHYYVGAASHDRFLFIEVPSPDTANEPVDLLKSDGLPTGAMSAPMVVSRSSDTDFHYNYPIITPRPRPLAGSPQDVTFQARFRELEQCLQFGLLEIKPGSIRWDGDHFTAEYSDESKNAMHSFSFSFGSPGEIVPESVKEKFLADLQNPTASQPTKVSRCVSHGSSPGPLEIPKPEAGSVESKVVDFYAAKHEARMARGISGQLRRDAQGKAVQIRFDKETEIPIRIELEYADAASPPSPFPSRIKRFMEPSEPDQSGPCHQITIYAARLSNQPLDDAAFLPWPYLKEDSYLRGKPHGEFASTLADPKDRARLRELLGD